LKVDVAHVFVVAELKELPFLLLLNLLAVNDLGHLCLLLNDLDGVSPADGVTRAMCFGAVVDDVENGVDAFQGLGDELVG